MYNLIERNVSHRESCHKNSDDDNSTKKKYNNYHRILKKRTHNERLFGKSLNKIS